MLDPPRPGVLSFCSMLDVCDGSRAKCSNRLREQGRDSGFKIKHSLSPDRPDAHALKALPVQSIGRRSGTAYSSPPARIPPQASGQLRSAPGHIPWPYFHGTPARVAYQVLRSSRSRTNTVRGSGCSGRSGKASRNFAIRVGLCRRKKALTSFSMARVVTSARLGS